MSHYFRADLSDFVGLWTKLVTDVHPIYILILQIAQGMLSKKNHIKCHLQ